MASNLNQTEMGEPSMKMWNERGLQIHPQFSVHFASTLANGLCVFHGQHIRH